jgi:putative transposase
MTDYRRIYVSGATWFFTVNLAERKGNRLLIDRIEELRRALGKVRQNHRYQTEAIVVLPDHLHWKYSSFHRFVMRGLYPLNWLCLH